MLARMRTSLASDVRLAWCHILWLLSLTTSDMIVILVRVSFLRTIHVNWCERSHITKLTRHYIISSSKLNELYSPIWYSFECIETRYASNHTLFESNSYTRIEINESCTQKRRNINQAVLPSYARMWYDTRDWGLPHPNQKYNTKSLHKKSVSNGGNFGFEMNKVCSSLDATVLDGHVHKHICTSWLKKTWGFATTTHGRQ